MVWAGDVEGFGIFERMLSTKFARRDVKVCVTSLKS